MSAALLQHSRKRSVCCLTLGIARSLEIPSVACSIRLKKPEWLSRSPVVVVFAAVGRINLESGEVEVLQDGGHNEGDKRDGYILACSCRPKSDLVVTQG